MFFRTKKKNVFFDRRAVPVRAEDLLRVILQITDDVVFVKDASGRYQFVNAAAERVMRHSREEIVGKRDAGIFPPDIAQTFQEVDARVMKTGKMIRTQEQIPDLDGTIHTWSMTKRVLYGSHGRVAGLIGVARDVTRETRNKTVTDRLIREQKEQIKELDRVAKDLVRRDLELSAVRTKHEEQITQLQRVTRMLVRRDSELTQAKERLEHLNREKSEFISIAAHRLRTPLTCIKWPLIVLIRRFGDTGFTRKGKMLAKQALDSTERMIGLVDDFLNVVRIEERRFVQDLDVHDVRAFIHEVTALFEGRAEGLKISFSVSIDEKVPRENVFDHERVTVVLQNLLDNAFKYSSKGGEVTLVVGMKDANMLLFSIADHGIGIPHDETYKLFQKFSRASNALAHEGGNGSGLGLFLVKNIVEVFGGAIWFESEIDKGSTFYFTLPVRGS